MLSFQGLEGEQKRGGGGHTSQNMAEGLNSTEHVSYIYFEKPLIFNVPFREMHAIKDELFRTKICIYSRQVKTCLHLDVIQ